MTDVDRPSGWRVLRSRWGAVVIAALMVWYAGTQVLFPGQLRLTAPITCDAEHPDLFVTKHKVERRATRRSPSFQHKAWCLSTDGDRVERSMFRAALPLVPLYVVASGGAVVAWTNLVVRRRAAAEATPLAGPGGGPIG